MVSYANVVAAYERVSHAIHRTPVMTSAKLDSACGRSIYLKCENLQKTGSFKVRGALNAVLKLKKEMPTCSGVVTHSSGNHGQALTWAAQIAQLACSVVVPHDTSSVKVDAIRGYGAEVVFCKSTYQDRVDVCERVASTTGKVIIPASAHYDIIAGQGTIAHEFLQQVPDLDAILVPTSSGGMTSGIAIATKAIRPATKVFAVEPVGKDLERSLRAGKPLWEGPNKLLDTIADGIRSQQCGEITFPILLEHIEKDVFTVTDDEIIVAMKFVWQHSKLVIETSSATGVAAAMSSRMANMDPAMKKVGIILCGGNVDLDTLPWM